VNEVLSVVVGMVRPPDKSSSQRSAKNKNSGPGQK
jgi:hypothetical protein